MNDSPDSDGQLLKNELDELKTRLSIDLPDSCLQSLSTNTVWVLITKTEYVKLTAMFVFPEGYPRHSPLVVQLKSKHLADKLLDGLSKRMEDEAAKILGQRQVLPALRFLSTFLDENLFAVCFDELQLLKNSLSQDVELKVRQKTGVANFTITCGGYTTKLKLTVPRNYPAQSVIVDTINFMSDLPHYLTHVLLNQAVELARRCVEAPLKKNPDPPFQIQPSLQKVADFLITQGFSRYPTEQCLLCQAPAFPPNAPQQVVTDQRDPRYVERVYCSHIFHYGCLHKLITTPPFAGGKSCPACGNRIFHERWKETPRVLEDRWAHKEAKSRELAEVVDFLQ